MIFTYISRYILHNILAIVLILVITGSFLMGNAGESKILPEDIIGGYRVMTGSPIPLERFIECGTLLLREDFKIKDLARYLLSLSEVKKALAITWKTPSLRKINENKSKKNTKKSKVNDKQSLTALYKKLSGYNNNPLMVLDDIIIGHRVMASKQIAQGSIAQFKRFLGTKDFTRFAQELMLYEDVADNFGIPTLQNLPLMEIGLHNGMTIYGYETDSVIAQGIRASGGHWEPHMEKLMRLLVKSGDVTIDVGANIGYFTAILSELVGKLGRVYAFEPLPPLKQALEKAVVRNSWKNVLLQAYALSDKKGKAIINLNTMSPGCSQFRDENYMRHHNKERPGSVISVPTVPLDDFLPHLSRVDYIKIDVEGAEDLVLKGADKLIKRFMPAITWEFNLATYRRKKVDPKALLDYYKKLGYTYFVVHDIEHLNDWSSLSHYAVTPEKLIQRLDQQGLLQIDILLLKNLKKYSSARISRK